MKRAGTAIILTMLLACHVHAAESPTLKSVQARGELICGSNGQLAGFGMPDPQGNWTGFDVDFCRAIASTIFGDPTKVKFMALTADNRFTALQSGEVDVLARNSTWTMSRNTTLPGSISWPPIFTTARASWCIRSSRSAQRSNLMALRCACSRARLPNLISRDYFRSHNLSLKTVTFATVDEALKAYNSGRCDAFTTDSSGLYGVRLRLNNPDDNIVLPEIISKEPLSPAVRQGDDMWENVVRWTHHAMLDAEELGVTNANVDGQLKSTNPEIRRLLGVEGQFGESLGLTKDWAYRIIKNVGNYSEVFERNVGQGSPLKIERGLNALWTKGGLQYGLPVR